MYYKKKGKKETRSIQRTQTPPRLWSLTLCCDLDLKSRSKRFTRCRLLYCTLVPGIMSVSVIACDIWPLVHFCYLWSLPVTFIIRQGHFHFNHEMDVMSLCFGSKNEVCRFNRIWDVENCLEKRLMKS